MTDVSLCDSLFTTVLLLKSLDEWHRRAIFLNCDTGGINPISSNGNISPVALDKLKI